MRFLFNVVLAVGLFLGGTFMSAKRGIFLLRSEKATGTVENITSSNGTCGSKNNKYPCTEYRGEVAFTSKAGKQGTLGVSAGSARNYDQPTSMASLHVGSSVPVIFSPNDLSAAFRDTFIDLWALPLGLYFFSGIFSIGAFSRRRR